jgi:rsbT co-antagonist protein RsbR
MTQKGLEQAGALLRDQQDDIFRRWIEAVASTSRGRRTSAETEQELRPMFEALLAGLSQGALDAASPAFDELRAMLAEYSSARARQGFTPSETTVAVFALRDAFLAVLQDSDPAASADFPLFSRLIDGLGLATFEAFSKARESVIANQTEQLLELSTPVVKLWDGILAVPLVGTLDSARTQVVMESLLQTLVATGSAHAIIDITGVAAVDTQVAQHLLKTVVAARLMGAECVISGIRPQIAQTIVDLGIEFGDIATKSSLADALRLTLQRAGLEVRRINRAS